MNTPSNSVHSQVDGSMRNPLALILVALATMSCLAQESAPDAPDNIASVSKATDQNATKSVSEPVPTIAQLTQQVRPSVVTIRVNGRDGEELAIGTGFVIDADGLIATNLHVISEGRPFTVELPGGRKLPVLSIESTDRTADLAVIRVDVGSEPLKPLETFETPIEQGTQVVAFGNPLGLRDSVVAGIVSAVRDVEGREMIQLAMPIQPGNSGGPLVDMQGRVRGIINMKSAIDDNLGFAIPSDQLGPVLAHPNPVTYDRWVTLGRIDSENWTPIFGASWQQRGGVITARGAGDGFGGRSLCLFKSTTTKAPIELAVDVRLDDESGAAGLAFHADGKDRHYGFYPSNGRMRLTCFKGPSVYAWEVLSEIETEHYLPGQWNRLRVRIDKDRFQCFVNGHLVVESDDQQLTSGSLGLVKFRDTNPDFKRFQVGDDLTSEQLSDEAQQLLTEVLDGPGAIDDLNAETMRRLGSSGAAVSRELEKRAAALEQQIKQMRRLAADVTLAPVLQQLEQLLQDQAESKERLLRGALLIAKLDNPDTDVDAYLRRVEAMAEEIRERLDADAEPIAKREALHRYLFEENGFHGGRAEYYHPANSHLDRVIDDREGLPITLSILYMELARRIGIQVEGVGLPGHFVVRHVIDEQHQQLVDVFERGTLLSDEDARQMVVNYTRRSMRDEDLRAQTDEEILARVVNNLLGIANDDADLEAIHRYCEALVAIRPDSPESRIMRSQARAMTKRTAGAVEDLDWLIERTPPGLSRVQAMRLRDSLIEQQNRD